MALDHPMVRSGKPWVRWWWFSAPIKEQEIETQLTWLSSKGFGGVEIAWVYPIGEKPGARFLDERFQALVAYAITVCENLGLGCDLTLGTLWPFNGSFIAEEHRSWTFDGLSEERINRSWEAWQVSEGTYVLDHLNREAVQAYADHHLKNGFTSFAAMMKMAFFSDSWEVNPNKLSFRGFEEVFLARFGYQYNPDKASAEQRYDYRVLLSERTLEHFFTTYHDICHLAGALSRVQCHGAPTDLLAAYALVDIPESETLLFDPKFSLLPSSAAAFANKPIVSSESFTCLYGWVPSPATPPGLLQEDINDLRAIADAQFAWGINRVVYHGMPFDPHLFYATVHIGKEGTLTSYLPAFNEYLQTVSELLTEGQTYSTLSILLPLEDQWMADLLPEALQKPSSFYYWELQELSFDETLLPWRPLYFSPSWVGELTYESDQLSYHGRDLGALLVDNHWLEATVLKDLLKLKERGAPIHFTRRPRQPGTLIDDQYDALIASIDIDESVTTKPIFTCDVPLDFWCRKNKDTYLLFVAHPQMRGLRYPMEHHFSRHFESMSITGRFYTPNHEYALKLDFPQCGSLCFRIDDRLQRIEYIALPSSFIPQTKSN